MANEREGHHVPTFRDVLHDYNRLASDFLANPTPAFLLRIQAHQRRLLSELARPGRFDLGIVVQTPGVQNVMTQAFQVPAEILLRHEQGDWAEDVTVWHTIVSFNGLARDVAETVKKGNDYKVIWVQARTPGQGQDDRGDLRRKRETTNQEATRD